VETTGYSNLLRRLPHFLRRLIDPHTEAIEKFIREGAQFSRTGELILDAGAGECRFRKFFRSAHYVGVDLAVGDATWKYSALDAYADLARLPFRDQAFDLVLNTQVLEHVREPKVVLAEIFRVLKAEGRLLLTAPQGWYEHQAPHDYFRFTSFALRYLLESAGFVVEEIKPMGGYFCYLGNRVGHISKVLFPPRRRLFWKLFFLPLEFMIVVLFSVFTPLILTLIDFLDRERCFTLGYRCVARKEDRTSFKAQND
jgi:SAM-dependent methyltransferase